MIRRAYLNFLLYIFTFLSWFGWEYAEDQVEDLQLVLNTKFIDGIRKIIEAIEANPEFLEEILEKSETISL